MSIKTNIGLGGDTVKINNDKLDMVLAIQCKTMSDLHPGISPLTARKIRGGQEVRPDVVGRVARALGVPVESIIEEVAK